MAGLAGWVLVTMLGLAGAQGWVLVTMLGLAGAGPQVQFPGVPAVPRAPLLAAQAAGRCGGREAENHTLAEVMEEYFQWKLATYPEWATLEGFPGYNHLVEDFSKEAILDKGARCQQFMERGCLLEPEGGQEVGHWDVFQTEVRTCVEGMQYQGYLLPPVNFLEGLQVEYPRLVSDKRRTPLGSLRDYEDLLARTKLLPKMVGQVEALLREGASKGITYARESLQGVDRQFERLQVPVNESDFYIRFRDMPGSLGRHVVGRMQGEAAAVVGSSLLPALRRLQQYLRFEYSGRVRAGPGVGANRGGDRFYTAVLRWHTSTQHTPQEVHDLGLEEVASLRASVDELLGLLGAGNMTFQEFSLEAGQDPAQQFSGHEEALAAYRLVLALVRPRLKQLLPVDTLTDAVSDLSVSAAPPEGAVAYYEPGSRDGGRPGTFFIQLQPLKAQRRFEAVTLALHEGNPGHHYQTEFNRQQTGMPRFMTNPMFHRYSEAPSRFPMNTAHVEGWGLYSEFLGFEMGLYQEDLWARFGHHSYGLLRAARLVVDTGIHALGWSRERAVEYMVANTALARSAVEREVDRYITWPGQAAAYKVGEKKIRELRETATHEMGDRFSLPEFHRAVLRCPGPLTALDRCVASFVAGTDQAKEPIRVREPEVTGGGPGSRAGARGLVGLLIITRGLLLVS